ncbi:MAG: MFS transporter [Gammaproteobacteria bacterium]|nr:MFS transporter [Gammaproteobacteria bacterium]
MLRTNLSIVSETMMHDLGLNEYQLGMVFSSFAAGYAILQFPGGIFGDRFCPWFTITAIAVAWALLTVATAISPGPDVLSVGAIVAALIITRFLVGAVHVPIGHTVRATILDHYRTGPVYLAEAAISRFRRSTYSLRASSIPTSMGGCTYSANKVL